MINITGQFEPPSYFLIKHWCLLHCWHKVKLHVNILLKSKEPFKEKVYSSTDFAITDNRKYTYLCVLIRILPRISRLHFGKKVHICIYIWESSCIVSALNPWSRVLTENLTVAHLVNKFPAIYLTRILIAVFTRTRHCTLSWAWNCVPTPTSYFKIRSNITGGKSSLHVSEEWLLFVPYPLFIPLSLSYLYFLLSCLLYSFPIHIISTFSSPISEVRLKPPNGGSTCKILSCSDIAENFQGSGSA